MALTRGGMRVSLRQTERAGRSRRGRANVAFRLDGHHARVGREVHARRGVAEELPAVIQTLHRHVRARSTELWRLLLLLLLLRLRLLLLVVLHGELDIDRRKVVGVVALLLLLLLRLIEVRAACARATARGGLGHLERERTRGVLLEERA